MSLPAKNTSHLAEARALLIEQFKNRPVIDGFLQVLMSRVQEAETAIWDVIDKRILDTAADAQLDSLGTLVGEKRLGRTDAEFRTAIRIRIRVNRSKGRSVDILDVASLAAAGARVRFLEYVTLQFEVDLFGVEGERYVAELLSKTRPASSSGLLVASSRAESGLLKFDDAVSPIAGLKSFTDAVSSSAGRCSSGYGLPADFSNVSLVSAPAFDPATLALGGFWLAPFPGITGWTGQASAGASGGRTLTDGGTGLPPSIGALLNGYATADFDGADDRLYSSLTAETFLPDAGYVALVLYRADTSAAAAANVYDDPLLVGDGYGLAITHSAGGFGIAHYDNVGAAWVQSRVAAPNATWVLGKVKYDGTNIYLGTNGGAWSAPVPAGTRGVTGNTLRMGVNTISATAFFDGQAAAVALAPTLTDTEIDNFRGFLNARFALSV